MMRYYCCFFLLALAFAGCKSDPATGPEATDPSTSPAPAAAPPENNEAEPPATAGIRYTWVDQLNVRDQPSTRGKVVARVKPNEPLTLTGETSPEAETIVLRGVAYHEPWYRITTADEKDGWVFGGAVKEKDEIKGNPVNTETRINFPVFGAFDLTKWQKKGDTETETGGDATITTDVYESDNQRLTITRTSTGEYGYRNRYELTDLAGNLQKKRVFEFVGDPEWLMMETVEDLTDIPAKRYVRSQVPEKHYITMNERPEMVRGEWRTERMD